MSRIPALHTVPSDTERNRDGPYVLGTNASPGQIPNQGVVSQYKNLLD